MSVIPSPVMTGRPARFDSSPRVASGRLESLVRGEHGQDGASGTGQADVRASGRLLEPPARLIGVDVLGGCDDPDGQVHLVLLAQRGRRLDRFGAGPELEVRI